MKKDLEWLKVELEKEMYNAELNGVFSSGFSSNILYDEIIKLILKVDEYNLPEIPQFVADYIEKWRDKTSLRNALTQTKSDKLENWLIKEVNAVNHPQDLFARVWLGEKYTIVKELYYAKVKGHELLDLDVEDDDEHGVSGDNYRNIYFVVQSDGKLIIDMKDNGLRGAENRMTKTDWFKIGLNDLNADLEEA